MPLDLEAIRKKLEQMNNTRKQSSVQMWKADVGKYRVRLLPWKNAKEGDVFIERQFYYLGGPGILAPSQFGKPDPVRELINKLFTTKDPNDRERAKLLFPSTRIFAPIIVRGEEEKGVLVWAFNKNLAKSMLEFIFDSDYGYSESAPNYINIIDVNAGHDIKVDIQLSKKKINNRTFNELTVNCAPQPSMLSNNPEEAKKWLDAVPNLDDAWPEKSYDEVKEKLEEFLSNNQKGVIGEKNTENNVQKQSDELSKLEEEIKQSVNASAESPAEQSQPVQEKKRSRAKSTESIEKSMSDLDKELDDLTK